MIHLDKTYLSLQKYFKIKLSRKRKKHTRTKHILDTKTAFDIKTRRIAGVKTLD